ncbi:restriction endonuclease subunit S [Vibrio sp. 10N.222.55.E8]
MSNLSPSLRFKEFKDEWTKCNLSDVFSLHYGKDHKHLSEGRFPALGSGGVMRYVNSYLYDKPSVLIGRKGTIDKPLFISEPFWTVDTLFYTKIKSNFIPYFAYSLAQTINWKKYNEATGVPSLNTTGIYSVPITTPEFVEQQKIADFLTSVDTKISQLKEKHRLLKEYKKGVMQKIFSQKIRFKDEDGKAFPEWTHEPIGKYLEPHKELVGADTDIPILTSSRTGLYLQERSVINEGDYGVVPLGYLTYRHMSDDLIFKFNVNRTWEKGAVSKEYPVFKTVGMDTYFLETQLNEGNDFKRFAIQQKQGGTRTRLYFKNLKELKLNLPCLKEQQRISLFLQSIDTKVEGVAEQIEQTKQFKKGLLQQMFV